MTSANSDTQRHTFKEVSGILENLNFITLSNYPCPKTASSTALSNIHENRASKGRKRAAQNILKPRKDDNNNTQQPKPGNSFFMKENS
jgi:hypothetical protein